MTPISHDLGALVVRLRALQPLTIRQHMGRAVQQFALDIVRQRDPALSDQLHTEGHAPKAYAASGLLSEGERGLAPGELAALWGDVTPGRPAWVRIVGLNRAVLDTLAHFAAEPPATVEIDRHHWEVVEVTWAHPWAGRTRYTELIRTVMTAPIPRDLRLHFAMPTAFHSNGINVPLPIPALVFNSLATRWTAFTNAQLPEEFAPFVDYCVMLSRHHTETRILTLKQNSKQIGFVGEAAFTLARRNEKLDTLQPQLAERIARHHDSLAQTLALLAAFAFYSGIGIKTTTGMGMAQACLACRNSPGF